MLLSVVIPCRNEAQFIAACLESVAVQQDLNGAYEIIVADGQSDDGTRQVLNEIARQDPRVIVIDNSKRIVSSGLNAAIRVARGDIIVRMDAHTEYAPNYLRECVHVLQETGADNVGGPWVARGDSFTSRAIAVAFQSRLACGGAASHRPNYAGLVDSVYLGCWRRETFERFGLFDEELVRNQDDEHNLRIIRGGGKIWQSPSIRSWYCPRDSLTSLFRQYMQYGYWKVRVIQKHRLPASWRHLVPATFLVTLLLLTCAAPFFDIAGWGLVVLLTLYGSVTVGASAVAAIRNNLLLAPLLPFVFLCFHFGYAIGFLNGVWDFWLLRGKPHARFGGLTRSSVEKFSD